MVKPWLKYILTFIAGATYALTYPSFLGEGFFPLLFIALPLYLKFLEKSDLKNGFYLFLIFNLGLNITGYYWIPHTLREFGQLPLLVSFLLGALFALILQPHWYVYLIWKKLRPNWNWSSEKGILLTAFIMTLLESFVPQQFPSFVGSPWLHLAPFLGLAPIFGVSIFSFFTYWFSLKIVQQFDQRKFYWSPWVLLVVFIFSNVILKLEPLKSSHKINVRIVQANVGNFMKLSSEQGDEDSLTAIEDTYYELSTKNSKSTDLIVWPETAYPEQFYGKETTLSPLFSNILKDTGAELLIGGYEQNLEKSDLSFIESVFNSSILLSNGKVKFSYHKNILIPFGETLPFGPLNSQIVSVVPAISLFARGQGTPAMETRDGHRFVTPICYEILERHYMRSLLNQWGNNKFIVNHTNDSWYGDTAEPYQHLFLSKWRALEFQLPVIRSTNTGISSVLFPDGSESSRLGIGKIATLDVEVPLNTDNQSTIFLKWGEWPFLLLFAVLYLISVLKQKNGIRP
jgi:apolipoprotein N-acyltransferase